MMNIQKIVSIALMVIGVVFLASPVLLPGLATVIYPEKFWYSFYPDGTADNPTMLTPGETIQLKCEVVSYDARLGISLPGDGFWTGYCAINGQKIPLTNQGPRSGVENRYVVYPFTGEWAVPQEEGVTYTFEWTIEIRVWDESQNKAVLIDTKSTATYAKTIAEEPDGYFTVNGKRADQQTTIVVLEPTLSLGFTATKNGDKISSVYVEVWKGGNKIDTVTLSGSTPTWTGTYTLPDYGTYQLKGFYTWTEGTAPIQKMSVTVGWNEQMPSIVLTPLQVIGIVFVALGAVIFFAKH